MTNQKLIFSIFLMFSIFGSQSVLAQSAGTESDPHAEFQTANALFEEGKWNEALEGYMSLINRGYEGSSLYYNLGNLYYRKGERGKAVLWYERAKTLSPRDKDIHFNLNLAQSHLKNEKVSLLERMSYFLSGNELSWLLAIILWAFFIILGMKILGWIQGEIWPQTLLWSTGILLAVTGLGLGIHIHWAHKPYAIVTQAPGEVRNGPGMEYQVGFTVPEGSRVIILNRRPEWVEVGVPQQGLKGWMPWKEITTIQFQDNPTI